MPEPNKYTGLAYSNNKLTDIHVIRGKCILDWLISINKLTNLHIIRDK